MAATSSSARTGYCTSLSATVAAVTTLTAMARIYPHCFGSILRIDVSDPRVRADVDSNVGANVGEKDSTGGYRVLLDNPFVGIDGARPEIWAYGLRNP